MPQAQPVQLERTLGIVLSGSSLKGDKVVNYKGEDYGYKPYWA